MIAFITWNSDLMPFVEGLCSSNPCRFEFSVFWVFARIKPMTSGLTVLRSGHLCWFCIVSRWLWIEKLIQSLLCYDIKSLQVWFQCRWRGMKLEVSMKIMPIKWAQGKGKRTRWRVSKDCEGVKWLDFLLPNISCTFLCFRCCLPFVVTVIFECVFE